MLFKSAIIRGNVLVLREMLSSGDYDVNARFDGDRTALFFAARWGRADVAKMLLGGVPLSVDKHSDLSPEQQMMMAALGAHAQIVDDYWSSNETNALQGHAAAVQQVLDGSEPSKQLISRSHSFLEADSEVELSPEDLVKYSLLLAGLGGHIDAVREALTTASRHEPMLMALEGHVQVVKRYVNGGIDPPDLQAHLLNLARRLLQPSSDGHEGIVSRVRRGADVDARDSEQQTPLMMAAQWGHSNVMQILIDAGADVNAKDSNMQTALMFAARWGHANAVKTLVDAGCELNDQEKDGATAVLLAAQYSDGHVDALELLLAAGADVHIRNNLQASPLMTSARFGHSACVRSLLAAGADMYQMNKYGDKAYDMAARNRHTDVAKILIDAMFDENVPPTNARSSMPI